MGADAGHEGARVGLPGAVETTLTDRSLRREAEMMGIYVSIALLGALSAGNDFAPHTKLDVLWVVWGTTIGLAVAHWFAVFLSMRLVRDPHLHHTPGELLVSELLAASFLAGMATLAVLVVPHDADRWVARLTAALFIAVLVTRESRAGGMPVRRAIAFGVLALAIGATIATAKLLISK